MDIKVLCIGDIVGRPGRQIVADHLVHLVKNHEVDCVIANSENAAGGSGITLSIYDKLMKYGVHLVTMGDHIYRKHEIREIMSKYDNIVKPVNFSPQAMGREWAVYSTQAGPQVAVISVMGRMHMPLPTENPFLAVNRVLDDLPPEIKLIVIDMHAEVTSEKIAMGWFLDGRVSLVYGTHTHVTTADETILPKGTAYITDVGMTGPHESVLGRTVEKVLQSLTTQMPCAYPIATGDVRLNGVLVTLDGETGQAREIERVCCRGGYKDQQAYDDADKVATPYYKASR
jgi:hypothetical protein